MQSRYKEEEGETVEDKAEGEGCKYVGLISASTSALLSGRSLFFATVATDYEQIAC